MGELFQTSVDRLVARLWEHEAGEHAPKPGEPMPDFVMPDEQGRLVTLDSLLENGPVAITFHRGHWCPYCRINTKALAEAQEEVMEAGGQIAAIMPDTQRYTLGWRALPDPHRFRERLRDVAEPCVLGRR